MKKNIILIILYIVTTVIVTANNANNPQYIVAVNELLDKDEIFIQFRNVKPLDVNTLTLNRNAASEEYVAIIIDPSKDDIKIEYLFKNDELRKYDRIEDVVNVNLSNLVWGKLKNLFKSKKNIYFSTSGYLANYPIEYLVSIDNNSRRMNETFNMYRVSSLEQLSIRNVKSMTHDKAVIFGGLEYDLNTNDTINSESSVLAFRSGRGILKELPEAKKEVVYIDSILRLSNIPVSLTMGIDGTSKLFKSIPSSKANILHVATHGYYDPLNYGNQTTLEAWMLDRDGICFAGEYNNSKDASKSILTGTDIASLEFSGFNLSVLSACQSGLGDVFEGYQYGLAKAFKDAGCRTIMSSLWEVNDKATCYQMESFYRHWLKNKDFAKSLRLAQNDIIGHSDTIVTIRKSLLTPSQRRQNMKFQVKDATVTKNDTVIESYNSPGFWASFVVYDAFPIKRNEISDGTKEFVRNFQRTNVIGNSMIMEDMELWELALSRLSDEESVVLFYNYTLPSMRDEYVAKVLNKSNKEGKIIPLFVKDSNTSLNINDMESLANTIWSKLSGEINDSKYVYYRPTGILTKIPFENLLQYKVPNSLYRITSMQTLINRGNQLGMVDDNSIICLIGGLDYKNSTHLAATLTEIKTIENCFNRYKENVKPIVGSICEEDLLKDIVNSNVLHIATHCGSVSISQIDKHKQSSANSSLSDLLLNSHKMIFVSKDSDYLVSALDVSKLDLSNVNLCVLSTANSLYSYSTSCQDFGFLRGLKLAGAKSILGSLWNVDDMSTNLLMQRFYANLMNGMSKHESLFEAQRYLREYEIEEDVKQPSDNLTMFQRKQINKREKYVEQKTITRKIHPYAKPEYWAAFILLDAID